MKLCGQCAAPLAAACPSCGASNPPANKFCGQCAAQLGTPQESRFSAPESYTPKHLAEKILASKSALEGERKQLTVLYRGQTVVPFGPRLHAVPVDALWRWGTS